MKKILKALSAFIVVLVIIYFAGPKPTKPHYNTKLPDVPKLSELQSFVAKQEKSHKIKPVMKLKLFGQIVVINKQIMR